MNKQTTKLPFADVPRMDWGADLRPRVKAADIEGQLFLVTGYKEANGEYGPYLYTSVTLEDGTEAVFLVGQAVLMEKLLQVKDFPVVCKIRKIKTAEGRECWVFVDPDAAEDLFKDE